MKQIFILKLIRNARKTDGRALVVILTTVAVLDGLLAHGTPVERMRFPASVLAAEVGEAENLSRPLDQLYGTWIAKDVDAKMGEVKIRLTFRRDQNVTLLAWSDIWLVGKVRDLEGPFSVYGNTISSEEKERHFPLKTSSWCCVSKAAKSYGSTGNISASNPENRLGRHARF